MDQNNMSMSDYLTRSPCGMITRPMDDRELFEAWCRGDREAGAKLFDLHYDSILRFFINKVGDDVADDLVQATFTACVEARDRFRGESSIRTFLFAVAHNLLKKHYRSAVRRPRPLSIDNDEVDLERMCSAEFAPSPSAAFRAREEQKLVLLALRRIPLDCQEVLELHYWENLGTAEIAEVVGVPVGTVKSRLQRGRRLVEEQLAAMAISKDLIESTVSNLDAWAADLRSKLLT